LHAPVALVAARGRDQLQVVDDQQVKPDRTLQAPRPRRQLRDGNAAGVVDIERDVLDDPRRIADAFIVARRDIAPANLVGRDVRDVGENPVGQLVGAHLQREEADDGAVRRHPLSGGGVELLCVRIRLLISSVDKAREIGINWWESDPHLSSQAQRLVEQNELLLARLTTLEAELASLRPSPNLPE